MMERSADGGPARGLHRVLALVCATCGCVLLSLASRAADAVPAAPTKYFNDFAGVTRPATGAQLNNALDQLEKESSSQIVVAVFPKLPDGAALEDFTHRAATAWRVGRKGLDNGAVLFVFVQDRKMRIEVGYGLEGKIPDAIAKRITSEQIKPFFQRGDYDGGLVAGVNALIQAARGEYKGTGRTINQSRGRGGVPWALIVFGIFFLLAVVSSFRRRGTHYTRSGRGGWAAAPMLWTSGGGGWGGGGGGGDSGGGFTGGGGSFGGGGASDSW